MRRMTGILVLAVALAGCNPESPRTNGEGDLLAAGIPGAVAATALSEQDSTPMVVRRLWYHPDNLDFWGGPSPDGRYLTYVDWESGDLALRDFSGGESRHLTSDGTLPEGGAFALFSTFSPDGERVAYAWWNTGVRSRELRVIGLDGSAPRVLYSDESINVLPEEWSSDGQWILVRIARRDDEIKRIGLLSVADGSLRVLKTLDRRGPFEISISPDGRHVIYDFPANGESPEHDVYVITTATGDERVLIEHASDDRVLGWAPDGRHVLFASDRTGTLGAWLLPVSDGEAAGDPRLVKPDVWRIAPLGFARDGRYIYGVSMGMLDVYLAALDPETGNLMESPTRASQSFFGSNARSSWSRDGRYLAYQSGRGSVPESPGSEVIVIRSMETGEIRELRPNLARLVWARWSPDGRSFLVRGSDEKNRRGVFRVDAQTAEVEPLILVAADQIDISAEPHAAGEVVVLRIHDGEGTRISAWDLETGSEEVIYRAPKGVGFIEQRFAVSPDSRHVTFTLSGEGYRSLMVVPTTGGEPRELYRYESGRPWPQDFSWSHDGRYVYYVNGVELWRVALGGGEPELLDWYTEYNGKTIPRFHPDGRRIAFSAGQFGAEVWVMEDFLPGGQKGE
jgi:Tol biopolymer transport system component